MTERQRQHEQAPEIRRSNFEAVESNFTDEQAKLEASRCLNCKNARCKEGCPVCIDIPSFIKEVKEDEYPSKSEVETNTTFGGDNKSNYSRLNESAAPLPYSITQNKNKK